MSYSFICVQQIQHSDDLWQIVISLACACIVEQVVSMDTDQNPQSPRFTVANTDLHEHRLTVKK